jgi:hypothetical protein
LMSLAIVSRCHCQSSWLRSGVLWPYAIVTILGTLIRIILLLRSCLAYLLCSWYRCNYQPRPANCIYISPWRSVYLTFDCWIYEMEVGSSYVASRHGAWSFPLSCHEWNIHDICWNLYLPRRAPCSVPVPMKPLISLRGIVRQPVHLCARALAYHIKRVVFVNVSLRWKTRSSIHFHVRCHVRRDQ